MDCQGGLFLGQAQGCWKNCRYAISSEFPGHFLGCSRHHRGHTRRIRNQSASREFAFWSLTFPWRMSVFWASHSFTHSLPSTNIYRAPSVLHNGCGVTELNKTNKPYLMDAYTLGSLPECLVLDMLTLSHSCKTRLTPDGQ